MQHNKLSESEKARIKAHHEKLLSAENEMLTVELKQFISGLPEDLAPKVLNGEVGLWAMAQHQAAKELEQELSWNYKPIDPVKDLDGFRILCEERLAASYLVEATWRFAINVGAVNLAKR